MRIGIDCRIWTQYEAGKYTRNIISQLLLTESERIKKSGHDYILIVRKSDISLIKPPGEYKILPTSLDPLSKLHQIFFSVLITRQKFDLFYSPIQKLPLIFLFPLVSKNFIITIHDVTFKKFMISKDSYLNTLRYQLNRYVSILVLGRCIKRASKIFVVSDIVKEDILSEYRVNPKKVAVTTFAASVNYKQRYSDEMGSTLAKYNILKPYILYVGTLHPLKNLERLLSAFELFSKEYPTYMLVILVRKDLYNSDVKVEEFKSNHAPLSLNKMINYVHTYKEEDVPIIYSNAELTINPTLRDCSEVNLIESLACRVKYVCSNIPQFVSIANNVPYYFNPKDPARIFETIVNCIKNDSAVSIEEGYQVSKNYSWEKSARIVFNAIQEYETYYEARKGQKNKNSRSI